MQKRTRMRFPVSLGEIAGQNLAVPGLAERLREAEIWRLWPDVVGVTVASRAKPLRIIKGTLTVAVSSGPWMQELRFLSAIMKEKLNKHLGGEVVREIQFKAGKVEPEPMEVPEENLKKKRLTSRQLASIDELAAEISDPETRDAFSELMKASLKDPRSR